MSNLPAQDLRSNVGTWCVPTCLLPAVAAEMLDVLKTESYDPEFTGQVIETTYLDTRDFALRKARVAGKHYLTLRVRCYGPPPGPAADYPRGTYAFSAKTEGAKFRVEIPSYQAEDVLNNGAASIVPGLLPADLLARLSELADSKELVPVVCVCMQRYAVEDRHRQVLSVKRAGTEERESKRHAASGRGPASHQAEQVPMGNPLNPLVVVLMTFLFGAVVLIVYDVWLDHLAGPEATISWLTWQFSKQHPVVPLLVGFIAGLLGGHLFWSQ